MEAVMLEWSRMCWIVKVKTPSWCYDISVYYYLFSLSSGLVLPHYHSHSPVLWFCDVVMTRYLQKTCNIKLLIELFVADICVSVGFDRFYIRRHLLYKCHRPQEA